MMATKTVKRKTKKSPTKTKPNPAKKRKIVIIASAVGCCLILLLGLIIGLIVGLVGQDTAGYTFDKGMYLTTIDKAHKNATQVGYAGEIIGTVKRTKPTVSDGGLASGYPQYGSTKKLTTEEKTQIINENIYLTANGTWRDVSKRTTGSYDKMDENGYLYLQDGTPFQLNGVHQKLYKHTGATNLYLGNVDDQEPAVVKKLTFRKRSYSSYYNITGLYAPAGEVVKIQISEADMKATGGIVVHIGQALYNGQANNIWAAKGFNRMPIILNTMSITPNTATLENGVYTAYVGNYFGGPIYIRDEAPTFSVTISGAVNYAHFILGVTTAEEYQEYTKSSAPYFDLEVWESGVLHSGPKRYAAKFTYDQLYQAAVLWEKIALVSTKVKNQGVVFLYDTFVAAGAAVAFPGRRSVNCPMGWLTSSLNYNSLVTSGSWGNLHEYHHNFQTFGVGDRGEVTNNALNIVAYSLFTKISAARQLGSYGAAGLSGWNRYTSATWTMQRVNDNAIGSTNGLAVYATLIHNLGQDAFIKSRGSGVNYYNNWQTNTHQDFSYFANLVKSYGGTFTLATNNYPMFVPVSCVYQTGRSYNYDDTKRYITTMQPYVINYGTQSFKVDLNPYTVNAAGQYESGSVIIAKDFTYKIKSVKTEDGFNGTFTPTATAGVYEFVPNTALKSGKIYVTLEITTKTGEHTYNGKKLDDVDLVLEFQQSHESKKAVLERTTYTYRAGEAYSSATDAFQNNYAGYIEKVEEDNINVTQNSNTDRWYTGNNGYNGKYDLPPANAVLEIKGKLYIPDAGKYRVYLRGRTNCAVYYSTDGGNTYRLGATITTMLNKDSDKFRYTDPNSYFDVEMPAESWLYFKEVLIVATTPAISYLGLGVAQWTTPTYTAETKYYNSNGTELTLNDDGVPVDSSGNAVAVDQNGTPVDANYRIDDSKTKTIYKDTNGNIVDDEVANNPDPIAPNPTTPPYATAYRSTYEFTKQFESEYFYTKDYNYNFNYSDRVDYNPTKTVVSISHPGVDNFPTQNLVDGNTGTSFHTAGTSSSINAKKISATNPFDLVVDQNAVIKANHVTFYYFTHSTSNVKKNNVGFVKTFTLSGSLDNQTWFEIVTQTNYVNPNSPGNVTFDFDEKEFRYYRLHVTQTDNGSHFAMNEVVFYYHQPENDLNLTGNGNNHLSPDRAMFTYRGEWQIAQAFSTFGHVYLGQAGAKLEFNFTGSRLAILSSVKYGKNYAVYIDGVKQNSAAVPNSTAQIRVEYLSPALANQNHRVEIICTGEANIDSIAIY